LEKPIGYVQTVEFSENKNPRIVSTFPVFDDDDHWFIEEEDVEPVGEISPLYGEVITAPFWKR
jgi:hypothetical protein